MTAISSTRTQFALASLCVTGLAVLVFGQTLGYGFVNYDDFAYVSENPNVNTGLSWHAIAWAFTHSHAQNWHPLSTISHMLDCQIYGLQPWGHHLTNLLLHIATSNLLLLLLWSLTRALWRSAIVAAIFAIHPLHVQSVAWIAERKDALSAFFFVLTLIAYVRYAKQVSVGRYLIVGLLFLCGLMSKPMLVSVPFVLLLLDYWPLDRFARSAGAIETDSAKPLSHIKWLILEKVPLFFVTIGFCALTLVMQRDVVALHHDLALGWRVGNALVSYVIYVRQMFWPSGLALLYPYSANPLPWFETGSAALFLAAVSLAVFFFRKRRPYLVTGWFWYLIMLLPVIGIIQVGPQSHADRYTYLPQIGLYILVVWILAEFAAERRAFRITTVVAAILIVSTLTAVAWKQASYWRDTETLWRRTVAVTSLNYDAEINLATLLFQKGQVDEAIKHVEVAMHRSNPGTKDFAAVHEALVKALVKTGAFFVEQRKPSRAVQYLEAAAKLVPDSASDNKAQVNYNLGCAFQQEGKLDDAIAYYQKALEIRNNYTDAENNLGNTYIQKGLFAQAIASYQHALDVNPGSVLVRNNLAWQLANCPDPALRDSVKAVALCEETLKLPDGANEFVLHTLAAAYAQNHDCSKALETANRALTLAVENNNLRLQAALQQEIALYQQCSN